MSTSVEPPLAALGWTRDREAGFMPHALAGWVPARVTGAARDAIHARDADGPVEVVMQRGYRRAVATGAPYPVVGDWLAVEPVATGQAALRVVLERTSRFARGDQWAQHGSNGLGAPEQVLAANVDSVVIVAALTHDLNVRRIERYLTLAWASGAEPVVLLNKADLCADLAARVGEVRGVAQGVPVLTASAMLGEGLDALGPWVAAGRTLILLGSSGVGKSTITNALLGDQRQLIQAVREDDSRGRHTTTARELFQLPGGGLLIDTPGMRSLELADATEGLERTFEDVESLAARCRFRDCSHDVEPGCAVSAAIERGDLDADRLRARRKLHREMGLVLEAADAASRRANARTWGRIKKDAASATAHKRGAW